MDKNQEEIIDDLAVRITYMQETAREISKKHIPDIPVRRGFHAKGNGVRGTFKVRPDLPENLRVGLFRPGAEYQAIVRFSNARSETLSDMDKDQRGMAIRIKTIAGAALTPADQADIQDFLMSNTPVSFARTPSQFIEVGEILLQGIGKAFPRLVKKFGLKEGWRIISAFLHPVISFKPLQMNTFWSRTAYKFGPTSMRFLCRPAPGSRMFTSFEQTGEVLRFLSKSRAERDHYMRIELGKALQESDLHFEFCIQLFVDETKTPIEHAFIEWKEKDAPPLVVAALTIPKQAYDEQLEQAMEPMAYNPWHTVDFTPLGLINLARKKVYESSAVHRGAPVR